MPKTYYLTLIRGRAEFRTRTEIVGTSSSVGLYLRQTATGLLLPVIGDPAAPDARPVRLGPPETGLPPVVTPPPPTAINWESVPTYNLGSGDAHINGGYYRKEGYNVAAFHAGYDNPGRLILENAVVWSDGPIIGGFRGKAKLINCLLIVTPPSGENQKTPRAIDMQEWRDFEMEGVTIIGGRGMYFTGLNGQFRGDVNAGQGMKLVRVKYPNIDGRRSDGAGGYVKSNWGSTHEFYNSRTSIGGVIGWDVANFFQINSAPRTTIRAKWCEVVPELGRARTEDTGSLYGGSGGTSANPGLIEDCLFGSSGGYDWRRPPDAGPEVPYDVGNQISSGATSPQNLSETRYSGTSLLIGDAYRSGYDDNTAYVTARRVIAIGPRPFISTQAGHDVRFEACELYETDQHWDGTPYAGYHEGYYQLNSSTYTASDGRRVFGGLQFFNNVLSEKGVASEVPWTISGGPMENGGTQGGNIRKPPVTDGGAAVIAAYRSRAQAAGVVIGSTLPVPPEVQKWASKA